MKAVFFIGTLISITCLAGRIETFTLDLERPQQPITINLTEATDSTISAELRASGSEFDPSGWTGLLWYGTSSGGITLTNTSSGYGLMTWPIPMTVVPTNGRYSVQILGTISNRVEEWGRGALTVRVNPSRDHLPAEWLTSSPWARSADLSTASNALAISIASSTSSVPAQISLATSGFASAASVAALSNAVAAIPPAQPAPTGVPYWIGSNCFATLEQDGRGYVWGVTQYTNWWVTIPVALTNDGVQVAASSSFVSDAPYPLVYGSYIGFSFSDYGGTYAVESYSGSRFVYISEAPFYGSTITVEGHSPTADNDVILTYAPVRTNFITRLAATNDIAAALAAWLSSDEAALWVSSVVAGEIVNTIFQHNYDLDAHRPILDERYAPLIPATAVYTNVTGSTTITNGNAQRVRLFGTGVVSLAFSGLNQLDSLRLVINGPSSVTWPTNAYAVGGYGYQTNRSNHYIVEPAGSELLIYPLTTTAD